MARAAEIRARLEQIERALGDGPFFAGSTFSIVDAVFGPVFRYFDVFDAIGEFAFWDGLSKVPRWRHALANRRSVAEAVRPEYPEMLRRFLRARQTALSRRMTPAGALA